MKKILLTVLLALFSGAAFARDVCVVTIMYGRETDSSADCTDKAFKAPELTGDSTAAGIRKWLAAGYDLKSMSESKDSGGASTTYIFVK